MKTKKTFVMLMCLLCCSAMSAQTFVKDSLRVDGKMRRFVTFLPEGIKEEAPLVVVLHGYGGSIWRENPMVAAAKRHGFAVCIPQGLRDPKGKPSWNVGYPSQAGWKQDDVKALCRIAQHVQKRHKLSRTNTFLTGMSNGGEMCYLMAFNNKQKTFKAVAPIAGLTMEWMYSQLEAKRPIPVMEVHGTADHTSEWGGDLENKGGWGAYMPVPLAVGYWVAKNRCTHEETERVESLKKDGHPVIKHRFTGGPTGCDVWLYEVVGAGHKWHTDDIDTGEEVWSFFSKYVE
ncbi:MAG: prolyl oligopeptidase family serine peptidase [Bacteroidaceae bacterium]|nr:prolyl oligopeptidase family serine peptidase [Bacteroidaceae bacterium]MBQ3992161.1 prolyl oligopeptidase family serine peptidase [Bacteroidaceae bacterium]MBQ4003105.1 prolyl oligopeptidase family serine peptidase [Bacteroidaceae bacterium]